MNVPVQGMNVPVQGMTCRTCYHLITESFDGDAAIAICVVGMFPVLHGTTTELEVLVKMGAVCPNRLVLAKSECLSRRAEKQGIDTTG